MTSESELRVYFACVGNSGRSQMAEAFCKEIGGAAVACASGGTEPYGRVLETVEEAMAEVGIDVSQHASTPIDEAFVRQADLVVTMGCGADACPAFHEVELVDWPLADPEGEDLATVRGIRDEIEEKVGKLLDERAALGMGEG